MWHVMKFSSYRNKSLVAQIIPMASADLCPSFSFPDINRATRILLYASWYIFLLVDCKNSTAIPLVSPLMYRFFT